MTGGLASLSMLVRFSPSDLRVDPPVGEEGDELALCDALSVARIGANTADCVGKVTGD